MSVPFWAAELAATFWTEVGRVEPFPRDLRGPISLGLPVTVVYLPRLRLQDMLAWLNRNGVACPCDQADRSLRACLFAHRGNGFIFLDGVDPEDEQRFSLAHELTHFLRDYWQPRRLARQLLGDAVLEVFDGQRPPTLQERLSSLLARVPIGFHVHMLPRESGQRPGAVAVAEEDADRLAYELLAPADSVLARVNRDPGQTAMLVPLLQGAYGLPAIQAGHYADLLVPPRRRPDPLLRRLDL